jgi:predicted nucleotidyltransferase
MDILEQVLTRASFEPAVCGVILTGSRARGVATPRSDYDVTIVVAEQAVAWRHRTRTAELDEVACTLEALADTSTHWQRYAYRGAKVLLDRLGGRIAELVDRQATLSKEETFRHARTALDAYTNQLYRAVKSHRDGAAEAAYLDEIESVPWLLETVFTLHGRLRPYNKYLQWELDNFPLSAYWNTALMPARVVARSVALFPAVEALARGHGHADVLDAWGSDIELIRAFAEAAGSEPLEVTRPR